MKWQLLANQEVTATFIITGYLHGRYTETATTRRTGTAVHPLQ
jgi:hypothetical protein